MLISIVKVLILTRKRLFMKKLRLHRHFLLLLIHKLGWERGLSFHNNILMIIIFFLQDEPIINWMRKMSIWLIWIEVWVCMIIRCWHRMAPVGRNSFNMPLSWNHIIIWHYRIPLMKSLLLRYHCIWRCSLISAYSRRNNAFQLVFDKLIVWLILIFEFFYMIENRYYLWELFCALWPEKFIRMTETFHLYVLDFIFHAIYSDVIKKMNLTISPRNVFVQKI